MDYRIVLALVSALSTFASACGGTPPAPGAEPPARTPDGERGVPAPQRAQRGPSLSSLVPSAGALSPAFSPDVTRYVLSLPLGDEGRLSLTPTSARPADVVRVNGRDVASASPSESLPVGAQGVSTVVVRVADESGAERVYAVTVVRSDVTYFKASNTDYEDSFGCSIALSGDTLAVGALAEDSGAVGVNGQQADESLQDSGAVYVFTRSGGAWTQQAYIKASNPGQDDLFGHRLALSGDTLAVSAWTEDSGATGVNGQQADESVQDSGAVYVFTRSGGAWTQQAYVKASDTSLGGYFGLGIALEGDTLVVGAPGTKAYDDDDVVFSGAAYVFTRAGATWTQQARLTASNPAWGDRFGDSVALSGDTIAVGAPSEDGGSRGVNGQQEGGPVAGDSGAVYVFAREGGVWTQRAYVKASNTGGGDLFGFNVALSGDTLAVAAPGESSVATGVNGDQSSNFYPYSGAVYVFTRAGDVWSQQAYIKASNAEWDDFFGYALALSGDTLVVSALQEDSPATGINGDQGNDNEATPSSGAAYVFTRQNGAWSQTSYVKASNTGWSDWFGASVALSGTSLAVGASLESSAATGVNGDQSDDTGYYSGAAYVFSSAKKP